MARGAGVSCEEMVIADGRSTAPFTVRDAGLQIPLVGFATEDDFGRLAIGAIFSDHEGQEPLLPIAFARGVKAGSLPGSVCA